MVTFLDFNFKGGNSEIMLSNFYPQFLTSSDLNLPQTSII